MSTPLGYRLTIRNATNTADVLVATSVRNDANPWIAEPPTGDGSTLDPIAGKVTVGAYTVLVIDAVGDVTDPTPADPIITDGFEYANLGALEAVWPTGGWGFTASSLPLNTTDALAGSKCAEVTLTSGHGWSGGAGRTHTFTTADGIVAFGYYVCTIRAQRLTTTLGDAGFKAGSGFTYDSATVPADLSEHTLTVTGRADVSGNLVVQFGYYYSPSDVTVPWTTVFDSFTLRPVDPPGIVAPLNERIVTASLTDLEGRQQLLSRVALIEFTEDQGATWDVMVGAYVNSLRMVDAITYEFTIGESKRIEQAARLFDRISDPATDPDKIGILDRASCIIGGPIVGDFGPTADRGRPIFRVTNVRSGGGSPYVDLQWESGFLYHGAFHEGQPPIDSDNQKFFNGCADDYLDVNTRVVISKTDIVAQLSGVITRLYDPATGAWLADHGTASKRLNLPALASIDVYRFIGDDGTFTARWLSDPPAEGTRYQVAVFPRDMNTRNPLHLSGHPVDLYHQLAQLKGIAVNADSVAAGIVALGGMVVDLEITEGAIFEEWVTTNLFGPFGFTVRTNAAGEREVILTRIRPAEIPSTTVTNADLTTDQGTPFSVDEASAAIKVTLETKSFRTIDDRLESTPIDSIQATKIVTELLPDPPNTIFGQREIRFTIPGSIRGLLSGTHAYVEADTDPGAIGGGALWLDTSGGATIETGAVLRVRNPSNGFWRTWNSTHTPVTTTTGLNNLLLVLNQAGPLEIWATQQYAMLFDWQGRGEITYEVSVRRGVVAELVGDEIVLDLAHLPTASEAQFPTSQRGTIPRRCQILRRTEHPEGPTLLLKDRGPAVEDGEVIPIVYQVCPDLDPPTALAVSMAGTTATLTWTVGDTTLAVEVSIRLATDDTPVVIQILPAESTTFTFTLPAELTEYTFAVRHLDAPPLHCASDYDEVNATTESFPTLSPPINPAAYADGAGTFGLAVTAVELAASVEFWFAAETSAGSGVAGAYTLYSTLPSVANGRTQADTGIAANDGTLRYLIARHAESGFTPSAYTEPVSINPWLLVPPVDPVPPVVPPLGLTALPVYIPFISGSVPLGIREFPEAATRLTDWRGTEILVPAANATAAHVTASILSTNAPVGAVGAVQYQHPCSCEWDYLDGESGPLIPLDSASLDALDPCAADASDPWVVAGEPVALVDDAKTAVRFRVVGLGGTEIEDVIFAALGAWLTTQAVDIPPPEFPEPPPQIPPTAGPCDPGFGTGGLGDGSSDRFEGYTDVADFLSVYSVETSNVAPYEYTESLSVAESEVAGKQCLVLKSTVAHSGGAGAVIHRVVAVTPSAMAVLKVRLKATGGTPAVTLHQGADGAHTGASAFYSGGGGWQTITLTSSTGPSGFVNLQFGFGFEVFSLIRHAIFDSISLTVGGVPVDLCGGSEGGDPGNTGIGDDGDDPVPDPPTGGYPPPPTGGERPFGISNISVGGLGFWDSTIKVLPVTTAVALLALATANSCKDIFRFGGDASLKDASGRFSYALWEAGVDSVYNDATANAAVETAIAAGVFWAHWLIDEPFHPRWGGISLQTLDRMATHSKTRWPTLRTLIRIAPNDSRLTRAIVNCDSYFSDYKLSNGDCATYRDAAVAAAEAMGKSVILGVHYGSFTTATSGVYITPDQLRHYGGIMASSTSPAVVAYGGWKFITAMNAQAGFPQAVQYVRDTFAARD